MKKNNRIKYIAVISAWLAILAAVYLIIFYATPQLSGGVALVSGAHFYMAITALVFKTIFVAAMVFYILPRFSRKKNLPVFILQSLGCMGACFFIEQYIQASITQSSSPGMHEHDHGFLRSNPFWVPNLILYIFFLLVIGAWYFIREWIKNEKLKRELIQMQLSTELDYLKNQVNPHFLFNTLNNLFSIAQRNRDTETADGISRLSGLMRYMLYESSVAHISLAKEIKNINDFIALSKLRYPNEEVNVEITTDGETDKAMIAPMLLLPFIENAFKHGTTVEEKTTISLSVRATAHKIIFTCTNPVVSANRLKHEEYGGIGLENVKRRLALLYPGRHQLQITDNGNTFIVHLELDI
jgi:hypothetical protein